MPKINNLLLNILFILLTLGYGNSFAQKNKIDSLVRLISITKNDTERINQKANLVSLYSKNNDSTNVIKTFNEAYKLSEETNYNKGKIILLLRRSFFYTNCYKKDLSLADLKLAEKFAIESKESILLGKVYYQYSIFYKWQDDYANAINYCFKALKLFDTDKDISNQAYCFSQLGNLYRKQGAYEKGKEYFIKSYLLDSTYNNKENIGADLSNLGLIYSDLKQFKQSVNYLELALEVKKKTQNIRGIVSSLNILGAVYVEWGKPKTALLRLKDAIELSKKINDNKGLANSLINIGEAYKMLKDYNSAISYLSECVIYSKETHNSDILIETYKNLSECYFAINKTDQAYQIHVLYASLKDSIYSNESQKQIIDMQTKYDTEKKEKENKLLQTQNQLSTATIQQQKLVTYFIIGGLLIVSGLAFFIFRGLKKQRKANKIISLQKQEVERQKTAVEEQKQRVEEHQKEILDSIHYAKRIQTALLPNEKYIKRKINELNKK